MFTKPEKKASWRGGLLSLFLTCAFAAPATHAGWSDYAPKAINTSPGEPNVHNNSGGRRIARINNVTYALVPQGSEGERIYRSLDNGGSWKEFDANGRYSGALVTGPDSMVYHFYIDRGAGSIHMVKFRYDAVAGAPQTVYANAALTSSAVLTEYRALNAAVDSNGVLYVASHWGGPDRIYGFRSRDAGKTWEGPVQVSEDNSKNWYYPHMEVTSRNDLVLSYHEHNGSSEAWMVARTKDGISWKTKAVHLKTGGQFTANPTLLALGGDSVMAFLQGELSVPGTFSALSTDGGDTWGPIGLVEATCGYGDPSGAQGDDGTIYVSFRSSRNTGVSGGCGDASREKLSMSRDGGKSWKGVDSFYNAPRVGTRSHIRYQTFWNYGGPLEWTWMQYGDGGRPIFYDINTDVRIRQFKGGQSIPVRGRSGKTPASGSMLKRGYPNPSRGSMRFQLQLPERPGAGRAPWEIQILDKEGRHVRNLGLPRDKVGNVSVTFDGMSDRGSRLAAGTYLCRVRGAGGDAGAIRIQVVN